jgi:DNA-directed RNA polymerase subunit alpha
MHQIHKEIGVPAVATKEISTFVTQFVIEPLPKGYAVTLGNTLRRTLLSSLVGVAVIGVKIKGTSHEFTSLEGVKDNMLDVVLCLKKLQVELAEGQNQAILKLQTKKGGKVTAENITAPAGASVINTDLEITHIEKGVELDMDILVEKGVGYLSVKDLEEREDMAEWIILDANFSPVVRIHYTTENARVGKFTHLDSLHMEIETNGSITPVNAFLFASNLLQDYFTYFNKENVVVEPDFMANEIQVASKEEVQVEKKESKTPVEVLDLSPRTLNALIRGDIGYVEDLKEKTPSQLNNLRGFGKRGMTELQEAILKYDEQGVVEDSSSSL